MHLTSLIALPLLRQASQDRLTDIITPVETILQNQLPRCDFFYQTQYSWNTHQYIRPDR